MSTGRRKKAIARVQLIVDGKGRFYINGKKWDQYFTTHLHRLLISEPLERAKLSDKVDVKAKVQGGGITGQAGAIRLGLARSIVEYNYSLRSPFKKAKLLTRDPRAKERKKYGQKGARRRFQWTKR
ncbi:MAG: 30S ribosomal protein S9 [Candidatus Omnitrophica bacterium]|nr:30S ribosomal protein S9 [Candidatus Omnitrophota bacterium]